MNILIVDDSKEKIAEVKTLLGGLIGTRLDSSSSGLEARERLSHTQYDLLILDIKLPFRDGDEPDRRGGMNLLNEITLSDRFMRPSHVVALTGFDDLRNEFLAKFKNGEWGIERYDRSDIGWRDRLRAKAVYIQKVLRQSGYNFKTDLCVIVALDVPELDAVRSLPWQWSEAEALDQVSFLYRGQYSCEGNALSVTAAAAPRMGMVASAILTQKLVHDLRPRMLAMTGICAGVPGACVLGDVLLANPCWDWQMWVSMCKRRLKLHPTNSLFLLRLHSVSHYSNRIGSFSSS
jgi:CheY-like chemotaxis protein